MSKTSDILLQAQRIAKSKFGLNISEESLNQAIKLVDKNGGVNFLKDKEKIKKFAKESIKNENK